MRYTSKNITFDNVLYGGMKVPSGPFSRNGAYSIDGDDITNIRGYLLNAIDINWNGAKVDANTTINTTAELLDWIKSKGNNTDNPSGQQRIFFINVEHEIIPNIPSINYYNSATDTFINGLEVWTATNTNPGENQDTYIIWAWFVNNAPYSIDGPVRIYNGGSGGTGSNGEDANEIEWIYRRVSEKPEPTELNTWKTILANAKGNSIDKNGKRYTEEDAIPNNWEDHPSGIDLDNKYEYASFRTSTIDNATGKRKWGETGFSEPILWAAYGEKGTDGDGVEYIFYADTDENPDFNIFNPPDWTEDEGFLNPKYRRENSGWSDDPIDLNTLGQGAVEWVSMRKKQNGVWQSYSPPAVWSRLGKDGIVDGYTIDLSNENMPVGTDDEGNVSNYSNQTLIQVFHNGTPLIYEETSGTPSSGHFTYTFGTITRSDDPDGGPVTGIGATINQQNPAEIQVSISSITDFSEVNAYIPVIVTLPNNTTREVKITLYGIATGESGQYIELYTNCNVIRLNSDKTEIIPQTLDIGVKIGRGENMNTYLSGDGAESRGYTFEYKFNDDDNFTPNEGSIDLTNQKNHNSISILMYKDKKFIDSETIPYITDGADGDDAVTYDILLTESWAKCNSSSGRLTVRMRGTAYKITGSTRAVLPLATIRYGYSMTDKNYYAETSATSEGSFTEEEWFDNDFMDTDNVPSGAEAVYVAIIVNDTPVAIKSVKIIKDGKDGPYYVEDYGISASRTNHDDILSWSPTQPIPTSEKPYVWKRSRLYNPSTQTYGDPIYVCLTGEKGSGGGGGSGDDGWMILASPANVILTQSLDNTSRFSSATVSFMAKKGNVTVNIDSISSPTGVHFDVEKSGKTVVVNSPLPLGDSYYTEGSFKVNIYVIDPDTNSTVTFEDITVPCYANLLGTWKQSVEAGEETIAASQIVYAFGASGSDIETIKTDYNRKRNSIGDWETWSKSDNTSEGSKTWMNNHISTAEKNISRVEKHIPAPNLFDSTDWTYNDTNFPLAEKDTANNRFYDKTANNDMFSPIVRLEAGTYTFSAYVRYGNFDTGMNSFAIDYISSGDPRSATTVLAPSSVGPVNDETKIINGITYHRRYAVFTINSTYYVSINLWGTYESGSAVISYADVAYPKLEKGNVATNYFIDSASVIEQTADAIKMSVNSGYNNFILNPKATDATIGTGEEIIEKYDDVMGNVMSVYNSGSGNFQLTCKFDDDNRSKLINKTVTCYAVVKPKELPSSGSGMICFGIWSSTHYKSDLVKANSNAVGVVASVDTSGSGGKTGMTAVGNGWYVVWATFNAGTIFSEEKDNCGINSVNGSKWLVYGYGVLVGEICPSLGAILTNTGLRSAGINIENGIVNLYGDKVTFSDKNGDNTGKVSIDPENGTLHAVDGDFSGTVTASKGNNSIKMDPNLPAIVGNNGSVDTFKVGFETVDSATRSYLQIQSDSASVEKIKIASHQKDFVTQSIVTGITASQGSSANATFGVRSNKIYITANSWPKNGEVAYAGDVYLNSLGFLSVNGWEPGTDRNSTIQTITSDKTAILSTTGIALITASGDITVTLPSTGNYNGKMIIVKKCTGDWGIVNNYSSVLVGRVPEYGSQVFVYYNGWH